MSVKTKHKLLFNENNMDYVADHHSNMLQMKSEFHCSLELTAFTDTPHTEVADLWEAFQ